MAGTERFDPYRILGVRRGATAAELAHAYRGRAKLLHPDLHGADADRQMRDLNRSWHILSDPERRAAWDASHPAPETVRHWAASAAAGTRGGSAGATASPAAWAAWEPAPVPAAGDAERVRVREAWPRQPAAPRRAERGLRESGWLAAAVAGALMIGLVVLGWVASTARGAATPEEAYQAFGRTPLTNITLDPANVVSLYRAGDGRLGVMRARLGEQGWQAALLGERDVSSEPAVRLITDDSGSGWRSFAFGTAHDGVRLVRLSVASVGGEVADGLWLVGVRAPLRADQLNWRFEDADGAVLLAGSGELH